MAPQKDPYAALPDTSGASNIGQNPAPGADPYAALPDSGQPFTNKTTSKTPPPIGEMHAVPPIYTKEGLRERAFPYVEKALRALPTIGGMAGGILGGGAGLETGPGAILTGAAGAAAGGGLGEDLRQVGENLIGGEVDNTPKGAAKGIAKEAALQGVNEATGRAAGKILSPAVKYLTDTADASRAAGVRLLPSEAKGEGENAVERFLKGSLFTSGRMNRFRAMQNAQTKALAEGVADKISNFSGTPEQLGNLVQDGLDAHTKNFRDVQNQMYANIDNAVREKVVQTPVTKTTGAGFGQSSKTVMQESLEGPAMPSMAKLKDFARAELKKIDAESKILDPNLLSPSRKMLQHIVDTDDRVTYKGMAQARSDMLAVTRKLDEALPGRQAGLAKKLASLADESLMDAAEKSGIPDLPEKIRAANAFTREGHELYEQQLVKKIVETKKPEAISRFLSARGVGLDETRDLMGALPASTRTAVQKQVVLDALRDTTNVQNGKFNEQKFVQTIDKLGEDRGKEIFGSNWKNISELAKTLGQINGPMGKSMGAGAALSNPEMIKNFMLTAIAPLGLSSSGHSLEAAGSIAGEYATLNALAAAITHPEGAARILKSLRQVIKYVPAATTGAYEGSKSAQAGGNKLKGAATQKLEAIRNQYTQP